MRVHVVTVHVVERKIIFYEQIYRRILSYLKELSSSFQFVLYMQFVVYVFYFAFNGQYSTGICIQDQDNMIICQCPVGYTGMDCEYDVDECARWVDFFLNFYVL